MREITEASPGQRILVSGLGAPEELRDLAADGKVTVFSAESLDQRWEFALRAAKEALEAGEDVTLIVDRVWTCSNQEKEIGMGYTAQINLSRLARPTIFGKDLLWALGQRQTLEDLLPYRDRLRVILVTRPLRSRVISKEDLEENVYLMGGQTLGWCASDIWLDSEGGPIKVLKSRG